MICHSPWIHINRMKINIIDEEDEKQKKNYEINNNSWIIIVQ